MTCDQCFESLSAQLDGELTGADQQAMELHLESCHYCQSMRDRLFDLSGQLKTQAFPPASPETAAQLSKVALEQVRTRGGWWWSRLLRAPDEVGWLGTSIRLLLFTFVTMMTGLNLLRGWAVPAFEKGELVARHSFAQAQSWAHFGSWSSLTSWAPPLVLLVGAWTFGLPALVSELWNEPRLKPGRPIRLALGLMLMAPIGAFPLLGQLNLAGFVTMTCVWAGLAIGLGFLLVLVKTPRSLPQLSLDFVCLVPLLAALEWLVRQVARRAPGPDQLELRLDWLLAHIDFHQLVWWCALAALAVALGVAAATALANPRRGSWFEATVLAGLGLFLALAGWHRVEAALPGPPARTTEADQRQVLVLAPDPDNRWLVCARAYPSLEFDTVPGQGLLASQQKLAQAVLAWDEQAICDQIEQWVNQSPGIDWGLAGFLNGLGSRHNELMVMPTSRRQLLAEDVLARSHWRGIESVGSSTQGTTVSGRLLMSRARATRVRLMPEAIPSALEQLAAEQTQARELDHNLIPRPVQLAPETRFAEVDSQGRFAFEAVPPGRYLVAVLLEGPADFTVHSSLPGQFEVGRRPLDLGQIVLTRADSELDLGLDPDSWTAQGKAGFLTGAEGPYLRLDANSSASRFVGTVPYLHKTVRFQVVSRGSGRLRVSLYTKGAGLKTEEIGQLAGERSVHEVELNAGPVPGYFQV
ncbi:MAG: zf-HC2 domain-containing protein, partial [Candidatus Eremiobacteraeota bacterium]|nr:zf-HC2 domain-containing protein [Candidatus Eremiobacteraeota bacterium]